MFGVEPSLLNLMLEHWLEEVRFIRSKRTPSRLKMKRKRYYRKRKAKIRRKAKARRRKPRSKRLAKRRQRIRSRLHIKPGSRKRIQLASLSSIKNMVMESTSMGHKEDLIRGLKNAAKVASSLSLLGESKAPAKSKAFNEWEVPFTESDFNHGLDEDFQLLLGITKKAPTLTLESVAKDATGLADQLSSGMISEDVAHQSLVMMVEFLDKKVEAVEPEAEEPMWTIYTDKDVSDNTIHQIEIALEKEAPEYGEYEIAKTDGGINLHGVHSSSNFQHVDGAIQKASEILIQNGYKVKEVAPLTDESLTEIKEIEGKKVVKSGEYKGKKWHIVQTNSGNLGSAIDYKMIVPGVFSSDYFTSLEKWSIDREVKQAKSFIDDHLSESLTESKSETVARIKQLEADLHKEMHKADVHAPGGQDIPFKITGHDEAETVKEKSGKVFDYPEMTHFNIESWDTMKLSMTADGRIIKEGTPLNGKGVSKSQLIQDVIQNVKEWSEHVANLQKSREEKKLAKTEGKKSEVAVAEAKKSVDSLPYSMNELMNAPVSNSSDPKSVYAYVEANAEVMGLGPVQKKKLYELVAMLSQAKRNKDSEKLKELVGEYNVFVGKFIKSEKPVKESTPSESDLQGMSSPALLQLIRDGKVTYSEVDAALEKIKKYSALDWIGDQLAKDDLKKPGTPVDEAVHQPVDATLRGKTMHKDSKWAVGQSEMGRNIRTANKEKERAWIHRGVGADDTAKSLDAKAKHRVEREKDKLKKGMQEDSVAKPILRTVEVKLPLDKLAKNLGYKIDADSYDDVHHQGYSASELRSAGLYLPSPYQNAEKVFPAQVGMALEAGERSSIADAIRQAGMDAVVDALEKISVSGEYQSGDGDMISLPRGEEPAIEKAVIEGDEVVVTVKNPEHLINDLVAGVGMFSTELDPHLPASNEDIRSGLLSVVKDFYDVYGERKPSGDLDSRYSPDVDKNVMKDELDFHIGEMTAEDIAADIVEAVDGGHVDSENDALALVKPMIKVPLKDVRMALKKALSDKAKKVSDRESGVSDQDESVESAKSGVRKQSLKEKDIKHENGDYWVADEGNTYTVYKIGPTHSTSDSHYAHDADGLSIAKARVDYLAKRNQSEAATDLPQAAQLSAVVEADSEKLIGVVTAKGGEFFAKVTQGERKGALHHIEDKVLGKSLLSKAVSFHVNEMDDAVDVVAIDPTDNKPVTEADSAESLEIAAKDLAALLGAEHLEEIKGSLNWKSGRYSDAGDAGEFEADGIKYNVIESEDEAEGIALKQVREQLEEDPWEMFNHDFLKQHLFVGPVDIRIMSGEDGDNLQTDLEYALSKENWDEIFNGEPEQEQANELAVEGSTEKLEALAQEVIERRVEEKIEETTKALEKDPVGYFDEIGGDELVKDMIKKNFLSVDVDAAAKEAVNTDSWAHFLSLYDGDYKTTPGGLVVFRED